MNKDSNVIGRYNYYPFGLISRSTVGDNIGTIQKFTGKELDDEHGVDLYYFGARYHDPVIGRFMGVDPMAIKYPSLSPYAYCANNPMILVDPDGNANAVIWSLNNKMLINAFTISQNVADQSHEKAWRFAKELGDKSSVHNGKADAFRHATWSKESSEKVGKFFTMLFGIFHELENVVKDNSPMNEIEMDLTNNKKGRSLANKEVDLKELAKQGELETLNPSNDQDYKGVDVNDDKVNEADENHSEEEREERI